MIVRYDRESCLETPEYVRHLLKILHLVLGIKTSESPKQQHDLKWGKKQTNSTGSIHSFKLGFFISFLIHKVFEKGNVLCDAETEVLLSLREPDKSTASC